METTIDRTGRLVVPKEIRDRLGLIPGSRLEIIEEGAGLRLDVVTSENVVEVGDHLLIAGGARLSDADIRELRLGDQR